MAHEQGRSDSKRTRWWNGHNWRQCRGGGEYPYSNASQTLRLTRTLRSLNLKHAITQFRPHRTAQATVLKGYRTGISGSCWLAVNSVISESCKTYERSSGKGNCLEPAFRKLFLVLNTFLASKNNQGSSNPRSCKYIVSLGDRYGKITNLFLRNDPRQMSITYLLTCLLARLFVSWMYLIPGN